MKREPDHSCDDEESDQRVEPYIHFASQSHSSPFNQDRMDATELGGYTRWPACVSTKIDYMVFASVASGASPLGPSRAEVRSEEREQLGIGDRGRVSEVRVGER